MDRDVEMDGLHPGRNAHVLPARLAPPATVLTGAAEECAKRILRCRCSTTATAPTSSGAPSASSKASTWTPSCWSCRQTRVANALREHPRADFKAVFSEAFRQEAARIPQGRARLLFRYIAFAAAIRFAPVDE